MIGKDQGEGSQSDFKAKMITMTDDYNEIIGDIKNHTHESYIELERKRQKSAKKIQALNAPKDQMRPGNGIF